MMQRKFLIVTYLKDLEMFLLQMKQYYKRWKTLIPETFYDNTDSIKVIITFEELILRKVLDKGHLYIRVYYYLKNILNIQIPGPCIQ